MFVLKASTRNICTSPCFLIRYYYTFSNPYYYYTIFVGHGPVCFTLYQLCLAEKWAGFMMQPTIYKIVRFIVHSSRGLIWWYTVSIFGEICYDLWHCPNFGSTLLKIYPEDVNSSTLANCFMNFWNFRTMWLFINLRYFISTLTIIWCWASSLFFSQEHNAEREKFVIFCGLLLFLNTYIFVNCEISV